MQGSNNPIVDFPLATTFPRDSSMSSGIRAGNFGRLRNITAWPGTKAVAKSNLTDFSEPKIQA
jgi:hypothetical protein